MYLFLRDLVENKAGTATALLVRRGCEAVAQHTLCLPSLQSVALLHR